ncbi:MAG: TorF family putative porin [Gammaproteobacteria bacterium]
MRMIKTGVAAAALLAAGAASAELTGNVGFMSNYVFRGVEQNDSSAMGGLDWSYNGFYLGVWGADVDKGLEIDYYGGYGFDVGEFSFGVGATYYDYTDNFDDNYTEANLSASWKWFTVNADIGKYDGFGDDQDYQHYALTWEYEGFHLKAATFEDDFDGSYYEAGYSTEVGGFDLSGAYIYSDDDLVGGEDNSNLMFTISKTFGILD